MEVGEVANGGYAVRNNGGYALDRAADYSFMLKTFPVCRHIFLDTKPHGMKAERGDATVGLD